MTLFLILKSKYFNQILSGEKIEEYREVKPYWIKKLSKQYDRIVFQEGYHRNARRIIATYDGYYRKIIQHEHFGRKPLEVFAIKFRVNG